MLEKRPKIKIFTFDGILKFNPLPGVLFIQKYAFSNDFILKGQGDKFPPQIKNTYFSPRPSLPEKLVDNAFYFLLLKRVFLHHQFYAMGE